MVSNVGSPNGRPSSCRPAGSDPKEKPIGTLKAGKPVGGDILLLLAPYIVFRSPVRRGDSCMWGKLRHPSHSCPLGLKPPSEGRFVLVNRRGNLCVC